MAANDTGPAWDSFGHTGWDLVFQNWAMGSDPRGHLCHPGAGSSLWGSARLPRADPRARLASLQMSFRLCLCGFPRSWTRTTPTPRSGERTSAWWSPGSWPRCPEPPGHRFPSTRGHLREAGGGGAQGGVHTAAPSHSDLAFWPAAGSPAWEGRGLRLTVTLQGRHRSCESQLLTQEQPLLPGRPESL